MGIVKILCKEYTHAYRDRQMEVRDLEDFRDAVLTPQIEVEGKALKPELSLAVVNEHDFLFIIHVAKDCGGRYYFGYTVIQGTEYKGCYPQHHFNSNPETETLVRCLLDALEYCKHKLYRLNSPKKVRVVKAANRAIKRVKVCRLKQLTIFDMM